MKPDKDGATAAEHRAPFWLRELPYLAILALTALGAGYFSMTGQAAVHYWDAVAVLIAVICIAVGWQHAAGTAQRCRPELDVERVDEETGQDAHGRSLFAVRGAVVHRRLRQPS